jgi:thymidine kinase
MAKLYFKYGTMGSGKTLEILRIAYNYKERGQNVLVLTSGIDNRYGVGKIKSRIGIEITANIVNYEDSILSIYLKETKKIDVILVDECQFFSSKQIIELSDICDIYNIPIFCFGLRSDFKMNLFEGSNQLLAICDDISECKTVCWCGKKAIINTRIVDNKIIKTGNQIQIGGNESYISLCRKHYKEEKLSNDNNEQ